MSDREVSHPEQLKAGAIEVSAAVVGAGVGLAVGGPVGALVGAALPPLVTATRGMFSRDRADRQTQLIEEAVTNLTQAALEQALASPQKRLLLEQALDAAARTANQSKVTALARVLASGLAADDATAVDASALVLDTLAQLEVLHVRLLAVVEREPRVAAGQHEGVDRQMILDRQPTLESVVDKVLEDCVRLALVYDTSHGTMGARSWTRRAMLLTPYGLECLEMLRNMDTPPAAE